MIFDLEADGLNPTKIYCVSVEDGETLTDYDDMREFFLSQKVLIGHNIIRFDIPVVERILNIKIRARLIDTLSLSWYLYPERHLHGLESWGVDFGVPKPEINDWHNLSLEEYCHRCEEDVKINKLLWDKQKEYLEEIYGSEEESDKLINYLTFKLKCAREQEKNKWRLDVKRATDTLERLEKTKEEKTKQLIKAMPKVPRTVNRTKPKKPYKKDGTLSTLGAKWFNLLKKHNLNKNFSGEVEVILSYDEGNPNSHKQIKDWLYSLNWKPETFKYNRDKQTNEFSKVEQVNLPHGEGICPSVKKLYKKEPKLQLLDGLSVLSHRISILKGFLDNVDEKGYVVAAIHGLTNTLRFKHTVIVNLPGVDKAYGEEIRGCLIAPEGFELCGSDQSSLEDRTKQHYMWEHDPDYVKEMNTEGFDPHLDIGVLAGMMTSEQADAYKQGDKSLHNVRHDAKQVNYSCTYGVTPKGIVRNTGMSINKATKLHKTYWKRNWSIQKIADECEVKTVRGKSWLFNPVSGLYYSLRFDKDKFSTLNQGTGVFCFDKWVMKVLKEDVTMVGQFHDEIILCVPQGERDRYTKILKEAVKKVNDNLKLNRELDVDVQFGGSYSEIH